MIYFIELFYIVVCCIVLHFILLYGIVLYCMTLYLYSIALYCFALCCIVLYCNVPRSIEWYHIAFHYITSKQLDLVSKLWLINLLTFIVPYPLFCIILNCSSGSLEWKGSLEKRFISFHADQLFNKQIFDWCLPKSNEFRDRPSKSFLENSI